MFLFDIISYLKINRGKKSLVIGINCDHFKVSQCASVACYNIINLPSRPIFSFVWVIFFKSHLREGPMVSHHLEESLFFKGWRLTLTQSMLTSISLFSLSLFRIPSSVSKSLPPFWEAHERFSLGGSKWGWRHPIGRWDRV